MWKKWKTNTWKRFRPLLFSSCWYYTMLQTKFRQTKYKIILKSYSVWHIICWVYLLSAQATSIQHLRRDIPNEKQRLRLFSSQKWLNNIKKFECKSVLLLLWIWFFFRFASSLVHSFHSLIIVSFGSDLNLRIMFVIWAITVDKKHTHSDYPIWLQCCTWSLIFKKKGQHSKSHGENVSNLVMTQLKMVVMLKNSFKMDHFSYAGITVRT